MNNKQRIHMMADLWPAACAHQGWNRNDHGKRYKVFASVLTAPESPRRDHYLNLIEGRGHISANHIINEDDISALFKELKHLAGQVPIYDAKKNQLLWVVRNQLRPCLALYVEQPDAYMTKILRERHKIFRGVSTIEDLSAVQPKAEPEWQGKKYSPLMQFIFTLSRCIDDLRAEACDTGHQMCVRARVKCKCADCVKFGQLHLRAGARPQETEEESDHHFGEITEMVEAEPIRNVAPPVIPETDEEVEDDNVPF